MYKHPHRRSHDAEAVDPVKELARTSLALD